MTCCTETNKLFDLYSYDNIEVPDESLAAYLKVDIPQIVPHTSSKVSLGRFGMAHKSIIERFVNHFMSHGRNNGKKRLAIRIVRGAFKKINEVTQMNPIQCLVHAVINSGPREISSRIGKGGNMRRTSVDVSPYKRINIALSYISEGIRNSAFKNKKTLIEITADELINAARNNPNSFAIKKKEETERIAKSNR